MTTRKPELLPLYDLKAPFIDSLNNYTGKVEILAGAVSALLSMKQLKPEVAKILQEALDGFRNASTGGES